MRKKILVIDGVTTDGKYVVKGIYKFYETHGVPLADILNFLIKNNLVVNWLEFCRDALNKIKSKKAKNKIASLIKEAVIDSYDKNDSDNIIKGVTTCLEFLHDQV